MPGQTPVLAAAICLAGTAQAEPAFLDGFDTLDEGRWMVSEGWSNGDWIAFTPLGAPCAFAASVLCGGN
jgi:beta-glucanase (GH16 family)